MVNIVIWQPVSFPSSLSSSLVVEAMHHRCLKKRRKVCFCINSSNKVHTERFHFFRKKKHYLLCLLHQQVDVVFLLFQCLSQNVHLSLIFKEFPLEMMVALLQGLTNRLNSEQMSTRRHISISQTDRHGSAINVIISSWSELTLVSSMSNRLCWSPQHKNCLTGLLRIKTVQYFKSNQGWDLVLFISLSWHTCSLFLCVTIISAEMTAVRPVSPPGTRCRRCLWTSASEAGQDQNWETATLTTAKEMKGWMTGGVAGALIVTLFPSRANGSSFRLQLLHLVWEALVVY